MIMNETNKARVVWVESQLEKQLGWKAKLSRKGSC
jgi:hypothetical protein